MMITMMNYNINNMANMLAEDTGAYELRNPMNSGMRKHSKFLAWLFGRKN